MPLPSSGSQIALSQIRNEFSLGSGQIAMSQLYGKGNAPASSGQINCGGHFHGVSASLLDTTMVVRRRTRDAKLGIHEDGFSDGHGDNGTGGVSYGSIADNYLDNLAVTVKALFRIGSGLNLHLRPNPVTSWTSITLSRGSYTVTLTRASASISTSGSNQVFQWSSVSNITTIMATNTTANV